ncbi:MAG: M56 family metallopeptidase [Pirellulaceae bacterium]
MNRLVELLAEHGGLLALGLTIWLVLGAAAMRLARAPILALRIGEATVLLALLWAGLACVPFDRYSPAAAWWDVRDWMAADDSEPTVAAQPSSTPSNQDHVDAAAERSHVVEQRALPIAMRPIDHSRRTDGGRPAPVRRPIWRVRPTVMPQPVAPRPVTLRPVTLRPIETTRPIDAMDRTAPGTGTVQAAMEPNIPRTGGAREVSAPTAAENNPWLTTRRLAAAYVLGSGLAIVWLLIGRLALRRLQRTAHPADPWLNGLYASVLPAGIGRRPRLLISDRCGRPLSFGLLQPVILLPRSLCHRHHAGALRHVLRHELAHVGQRDAWGHLLFNIAFPLCYFHPLYWWLRARAGLCRELIADDQAAACTDKRAYVGDLLAVARQWQRRCDAQLGALSVFESSSQFYRRMTMLCERERPLERSCAWWWRGGLVAIGCLTVLVLGLTLGRPATADDDAVKVGLLALAGDAERDDDEANEESREEVDDDKGESEEEERDEDESEPDEEEESDDVADEDAEEDDEDAEEEESDEESDDENDAEDGDESEEEESDDEETDEDEGDEEDDDAAEDEGDLDALMAEKEEVAGRLAELEATIEEAATRRAQRQAERESAAEAEAREAAEQAEAGQWQNLLDTLAQLSEQQERLKQTVGEMAERIDELTRDKEALSEEVNSLRERLAERGGADEEEEDEVNEERESSDEEDDEAEEVDREDAESDDDE